MASTVDEFRELLSAETFVEVDKVRDIAQHGVPVEVRGEVWKYLLGVDHADKSNQMRAVKAKTDEYGGFGSKVEHVDVEVAKRLVGEIKRYRPDVEMFRDIEVRKTFEHVILAHMSRHKRDFDPTLVLLCGPFVHSMRDETDIFYSFDKLMGYVGNDSQNQERIVKFIMLFRTFLPELFNHFEEEEVAPKEWANDWIRLLLAKQLPLPCVERLWDTYFANLDTALDLHIYVCLAILKLLKEELEDLEHSEVVGFLKRLPANMDMGQIIAEAHTLRRDVTIQDVLPDD
eukprot:Lithocolla_globosa_v1_NODE_5714_length_1197_cov_28.175131.p1 type:complete len:287 gc:universal NODE_5714_length_1197_cov_28.175131:861-1(-)